MARMRPWVAVTSTDEMPVTLAPVRAALRGVAPVRVVGLPFRPLDSAETRHFARELSGAFGMLLRPGYVTSELLELLPALQVVAVHGAGVDQVDVEACTARGVLVTNAPGANAVAVAELTIALMLNLARRVPESAARVRAEGAWGEARHTGIELRGRTLGLVGLGQIGRRVGEIAAAIGMTVVAYDPGLEAREIRSRGARPVGFEALLAEADVISLHAPHIPQTERLMNRAAFAKMKKGALLVNAARGPLIDEKALARALRSGRVGGAALDVLDGEPPDPESPLFAAPNVLVTPHMAGSTVECLAAIAATAGADIARVLGGKAARFPVNRPSRPRA